MTSDTMLGIDTGGTYTDAVIYSETAGILAKAKALTTRHDRSGLPVRSRTCWRLQA